MSTEVRTHHPYSPSTLQPTEACPCYQGRESHHVRTIVGTISHKVTETREDDNRLDDEDAANAAACLDFYDARRVAAIQFRRAAVEKLGLEAWGKPVKEGEPAEIMEYGEKHTPQIIEHTEVYLPVDDLVFPDGVKHTTAGFVDRALIAHNREYAELFDWKFGVWPVEQAENNLQGIAYSLGLFKKYPTLKKICFFFKQPLADSISHAVFTREKIGELYLRIQIVVARAREARAKIKNDDWSMARPYVPVCNFCDNIGRCHKVLAMACNVAHKYYPLEIPADVDPMVLKDRRNTNLAMRLAAVMAIWAKHYRTAVSDRVIRRDMDVPDGFIITSRSERKIVDPAKVREIALKYMTPEEYEALLSKEPPFGELEEQVKAHAPRGQKTDTLKQFQKELIDAEAVKREDPYTFLKAVADKDKEKH